MHSCKWTELENYIWDRIIFVFQEKKKIGQYPMALKIIDAFQFDEDENYDSAVFDVLFPIFSSDI